MDAETETSSNQDVLSSPKLEKPNSEIQYPDEYRERIGLIHKHLSEFRQQGDDKFNLGPTYHLQTSKGEPLMIESFSRDFLNESGLERRTYYLIAQDMNGNIVGDRATTLGEWQFQGVKYAKGEGMIATGKRGGSITGAIEAAHMDILQREAKRRGMRVDWKMSNSNAETLRELQEEFRLNPSEDLQSRIQEKVIEQQRWQAIYGKDGKIGFDQMTGKKSFIPEDPIDKYAPVGGTIQLPPENQDLYERSRTAVLDRIMTRMEEIAK